MSRRVWGLVALLATATTIALVLAWPGGSAGQKSYAQQQPQAYIDKNIHNGSGPCDPNYIDDETTEVVGSTHEVAVCVRNLQDGVESFSVDVRYDDTLDTCDDEVCTDQMCLDDNPDANLGETTWGDGLGEGWHCWPEEEPVCDDDESSGALQGLARISCYGPYLTESATLGDDETWGVLAVLTLRVTAPGTDHVVISSLYAYFGGEETLDCYLDPVVVPTPGGPCEAATDVKVQPTPHRRKTATPTATVTATATPKPTEVPPTPAIPPTPTATPTMFGGPGGIVVKAPPTGSGPQGEGFPWQLASVLAVAAGAAAAAGGLRLARGSRG